MGPLDRRTWASTAEIKISLKMYSDGGPVQVDLSLFNRLRNFYLPDIPHTLLANLISDAYYIIDISN